MSADILTLPNRGRGTNFSSLQSKLEVYQKLTREWAEHLDPYEFRVLSTIIDRTIGWGDLEAQFSAGRLLRGDKVCGPLNMGRTKLYDALASLEEKGFIRRRADPSNPEKIHYSVRPEWSPKMALALPKRLKNAATGCTADLSAPRTPPVRLADTPVRDADTIYRYPSTGNLETGNAASGHEPPSVVEQVREKAATAAAKTELAKAARREVHRAKNSAASVEAVWREALAETFPVAVEAPWAGREKGQAARLAKAWIHGKQISFADFTDWAVRNWTQIMRKQFKWMTKSPPPAVPAFTFFAAMIDQFAECWGEGKLQEWASAKERTEVERMMSRGMTFEQAAAEFAKNNVAQGLRKEMAEREIKVSAKDRGATRKLEQAKKLAEYGGSAPVHPRSAAAQALLAAGRPQSAIPARRRPVAPDDALPPLSVPMVDPSRNPFDE